MNYLFDPDFLAGETATAKKNLSKNNPDADFTKFAAGVIYERLKSNILRYRVYGLYWYALKAVLKRQGYDLGAENDTTVSDLYKGANDAETIVAADIFYLDMSSKNFIDNNAWMMDNRKPDYVLYDADMEERRSVDDPLLDV